MRVEWRLEGGWRKVGGRTEVVGRRTEVVGRRMEIEGVVRMYNDVVCRMSAHGCMAAHPSHLVACTQGLLLCNMEMGYQSSVLMHVSGLTEKQ